MWPRSAEELVEAQRALATARPPRWLPPDEAAAIGACAVCFPRATTAPGTEADRAWAAAAVLRRRQVLADADIAGAARAPYVDGLLAVFGAPERRADHAARAVAAAREIAQLVRHGLGGELRVGVGVNSGRVVVGTIGLGGRRDFTVIGDPVNTAARVEAATRLTGDDVLVTETTLRALGPHGDDFEERPSAPLKGEAATVRLYAPPPDSEPGAQHPATPS